MNDHSYPNTKVVKPRHRIVPHRVTIAMEGRDLKIHVSVRTAIEFHSKGRYLGVNW